MTAVQVAALDVGRVGPECASRPRWGMQAVWLSALAVAYPFHYYVQGPGGTVDVSLGDALVAVVILGFCCSLLWDRWRLPRLITPTLTFTLVALASLLYPLAWPGSASAFFDPVRGLLEIVKVAGSAAWMVALYVLLRGNLIPGLRIFSLVSVIAACAFAVGTINESLMHPGTRPSGPFENENLYANYLTLNVFLSMMLARLDGRRASRSGIRVPVWMAIPVLLVGLLATGSRGALIGAALAFPLAVRWRRPSRFSMQRIAVFAGVLGLSAYGLIVFWHANPFIASRVSTVVSGEGPNIEDRRHLWGMAAEAFWTSPLVGIGYGQFPEYAQARHGWKVTVPHNTYLSIGAELGLVGLAALAWLLFAVIRDAARLGHRPELPVGRVLLAIVAATLVQGLVANVEHYRSLWIAMGMLAAIDDVFWRRRRPARAGRAEDAVAM